MKNVGILTVLLLFVFLTTGCGDGNGFQSPESGVEHKSSTKGESTEANATQSKSPAWDLDETSQKVDEKKERRHEAARRTRESRESKQIFDALESMHELMSLWDPVGASVDDVVAEIGEPTSTVDGGLVYRLDNGRGGWEWRFKISEGVVVKVEKRSLD